MHNLDRVLETAVLYKASDVILTAGRRVVLKINGTLQELEGTDVLTEKELEEYLFPLLEKKGLKDIFLREKELDFAYEIPGKSRFRVNFFYQRGKIGAVFRLIPVSIPRFQDLGLPPIVKSFIEYPKGLILVTGPTGSGKSTTLASLLQLINETKSVHIITLEDPIEYIYEHKKATIEQREIGEDTRDFKVALRHILRQAPDVVLVGEMRDLETMQAAITLAETGHLVFATLHTLEASQTVDRIIDAFPEEARSQIRIQLSLVLMAVLSQQLLPTRSRQSRVVVTEVMIVNNAIRSLIREGKTHQIYSVIQSSGNMGSCTMNQSLKDLYQQGLIDKNTALSASLRPDELDEMLEGIIPKKVSALSLDNDSVGSFGKNPILKEKDIRESKKSSSKEAEDEKKDKNPLIDLDFDLKI